MKKLAIYILLLATLVLQSCVAYQSTSVSVNEAYNKGNVRVHTTSGEKIKFQNIELMDTTYYGVTENNKVKLDPTKISAVFLEYIRTTNNENSFMYLGPGGVLGAIFIITNQ